MMWRSERTDAIANDGNRVTLFLFHLESGNASKDHVGKAEDVTPSRSMRLPSNVSIAADPMWQHIGDIDGMCYNARDEDISRPTVETPIYRVAKLKNGSWISRNPERMRHWVERMNAQEQRPPVHVIDRARRNYAHLACPTARHCDM